MVFSNAYFFNGTAYAGKSTLVHRLAEKYGGIECGENYHDALTAELDAREFPCITYLRDMRDWRDFIRRTPEAYEAWVDGTSRECERLELRILTELSRQQDRLVFVDTNISPETLKTVAAPGHVLIMLADPGVSVSRFFDRPDREKQFLYRLLMAEPDPEAALENFRQCLMRVNSRERYDAFLHAGFPVLLRDDGRTIEETMAVAERMLGLA